VSEKLTKAPYRFASSFLWPCFLSVLFYGIAFAIHPARFWEITVFKKLNILIATLAFGFVSFPASAVLFVFSNEFSGAQDCANVATTSSCATLSVEQNGANVDFVLTGNLATGEHIKELSGNQFPFDLVAADFSAFTGSGADAVDGVTIDEDGLKADGDGWFDWRIDFDNSPAFDGVDTLSWSIANTTLDEIIGTNAISVNGTAGKDGFTFAIHAGGFVNNGSGWFSGVRVENGGGEEQVSEPSVLALLGLSLLMLGFVRRRKAIA
jgi:hypothetical protein